MADAIRTEELTRDFAAVRAVANLTLTVPAGIVFGFLGPNGSGKTTTIMLLLFIPVFGVQALPAQVRAQMAQVLNGISFGQLVLGAAGVLALVDALLLVVGMARFKRAKLILD